MKIRGVEIIPPTASRVAWELAFLIRAVLATRGMRLPADEQYIAQVQRAWLNLPPGPHVASALTQFVLGMDTSVDRGIFSEDPIDALYVLATRASKILSERGPRAYIREQVLYRAGLAAGPRPSDLAMLKGGEREVCSLDAIVRRENGKSVGTVAELASTDLTITIDLGLTQLDMENLVSQLRSGSPKDKKLADAITGTVKSGKLAPNGPDKYYQMIRRNEKKLRNMAKRLRASKQRGVPLTGGAVTLTIIGERVLATTSNQPVQHSGTTSHVGLVFKPANMELDESKPTKQQAIKKKTTKKKPIHKSRPRGVF